MPIVAQGEYSLVVPPNTAHVGHIVHHLGYSHVPFSVDLVRQETYWPAQWIADMHLPADPVSTVDANRFSLLAMRGPKIHRPTVTASAIAAAAAARNDSCETAQRAASALLTCAEPVGTKRESAESVDTEHVGPVGAVHRVRTESVGGGTMSTLDRKGTGRAPLNINAKHNAAVTAAASGDATNAQVKPQTLFSSGDDNAGSSSSKSAEKTNSAADNAASSGSNAATNAALSLTAGSTDVNAGVSAGVSAAALADLRRVLARESSATSKRESSFRTMQTSSTGFLTDFCVNPFLESDPVPFTVRGASVEMDLYSLVNPLGLEHPAYELHHFAISGTYSATNTFFVEFVIERTS